MRPAEGSSSGPGSQTTPLQSRWFDHVRADIQWQSGTRFVHERQVDVPRLRAHFRSSDAQLPVALREAVVLVTSIANAPLDSMGLNLYRDQHDSLAPHSDKLAEIARAHPIRCSRWAPSGL